jgi:hypothetical protein
MTHSFRSSEYDVRPLLKLVTAVLAAVSIFGTAAAHSWDVSVRGIYRPVGNTDSGTAVVPMGIVKNFGDSTASFPLLFTIDTVYADTQNVSELASGEQDTVAFDTWLAIERGRHTARCSTALAEDESTANDRVARNITIVVRDISFDSIIAPKGDVYLKIPMTPQTRLTNRGTNTVGFRAVMRIGPSYADSQYVPDLPAESSRTVSFDSWTPWSLGKFAVLCTLGSSSFNDMVPGDEWTMDSCMVSAISRDAGTMRVAAPTGMVDSGAVVEPQVVVRNCGSNTISFPVVLRIGADYVDTADVSALARYDSALVTFDEWTASPVGTIVTRCSTALADDSNPTNDARSDSVVVFIRRADVGATRFVGLPDTVNWITVLSPQAVVYNYGLDSQSFAVALRIKNDDHILYDDVQQVTSLASLETLVVTFKEDSAMYRGAFVATCSTRLAGDQVTANDKVSQDIFVSWPDVGAVWIIAPGGTVPIDTVVTPAAYLDIGTSADSFLAIFRVGTFYAETVRTRDSIVRFPPCTLKLAGTWMTRCSTALSGDIDSTNDLVRDSVTVAAGGISGGSSPGVPRDVVLSAAGSNVLVGGATIKYGLPRNMDARLVVYDACGRPVRVLTAGAAKPGYYMVTWQGTDERGRAVPGGAYFVRLTAGGKSLTAKLVKLE